MDQTSVRVGSLKLDLADLDPEQVVFDYDRESDTLMVHFYGLGIPATSVLVNDEFMLRVNREDNRTVGFQVDHFLAIVVHQQPDLIDILDIAETHGLDAEEVMNIRRDIARQRRSQIVSRSMTEVETIATAAD